MTSRRALVTGATGQDGRFLAELLIARGYKVYGLVKARSSREARRAQSEVPALRLLEGDLTDRASLVRCVRTAEPTEVYNLAAMSSVDSSWQTAERTSEVNALGVVRLLEVLREAGLFESLRFYQASSSEIFGRAQESPQSETTPLHPRSPYGVSKAFAHQMIDDYRERHGVFASAGILYNHESERRPTSFVVRKVTRAVALIKHGLADHLVLGDLKARRDWGFAGDYVEAMWLMLQADEPRDYVVATGRTRSVADLVETAFACAGILDWDRHVRIDESLVRPPEPFVLTGDASLARQRLGWKPALEFSGLIARMVEADLQSVAAEQS